MSNSAPTNRRPVFVVGCPRSGNTLMGCLLDKHPDFAVFFEQSTFYSLQTTWSEHVDSGADPRESFADVALQGLAPWLEQQSCISLPRDEVLDVLGQVEPCWPDLLDAFMRLQMRKAKPGASRWGDKTPQNVARMASIVEAFPQARIIYVYRDPRHSVVSLSNPSFPHASDDELVNAEVVRHYQRVYEQQKQQVPPANLIEVRYEELLDDPPTQLARVCSFLQVDFDEAMLGDVDPEVAQAIGWVHYKGWQKIRPQPSARTIELRAETQARLEPLLAQLGYDYRPTSARTRLRAQALTLPFRGVNQLLNALWRVRHPSAGDLFLKDLPSWSDYLRWVIPHSASTRA
ncbi:sulfotransferase family protein [Persicimonas caeni]|nr:sulfotransferase [Persicimonas caeni]